MSVQSIGKPQSNAVRAGLVGFVGLLIAVVVFNDALSDMLNRWISQEEYSHGFLIPIVAAWLLWTRRDALSANFDDPVWTGPAVVALATAMHLFGELSGIFILSQLGFVLAIVGLVLALGGYALLRTVSVPIVFLLFAIPMPRFIDSSMSLQLQLVSSEIGALVIRMFQIPVYLDGNVIDLGLYKVQVVEACSGLRYIYPLLSLSFLAAYLFQAPLWQRAIVFFSAIPITVIMNSLRIGLVGVTVNYFGSQAADGVLHLFEGWVIFLACGGILAFEIWIFARISRKPFFEVLCLPKVAAKPNRRPKTGSARQVPLLVSLFLLGMAGLAMFNVSARPEAAPDRPRFVSFPDRIGSWRGRPTLLDAEIERTLRPDDYLLSDYQSADGKIVNFYVAYYASQRKSEQPHSPSDCIPASGWRVVKFERTSYDDNGAKWPINRVVIEKNSIKQIVYYWFDERGRKIASEYAAKWYLHADAVVMNRTDGALVRLVTQVTFDESERDADARLTNFIRSAMPSLAKYLPGETVLLSTANDARL